MIGRMGDQWNNLTFHLDSTSIKFSRLIILSVNKINSLTFFRKYKFFCTKYSWKFFDIIYIQVFEDFLVVLAQVALPFFFHFILSHEYYCPREIEMKVESGLDPVSVRSIVRIFSIKYFNQQKNEQIKMKKKSVWKIK